MLLALSAASIDASYLYYSKWESYWAIPGKHILVKITLMVRFLVEFDIFVLFVVWARIKVQIT